MPTRNTMVVPCTVNSRLKTCGETIVLPAAASCQRITAASRPAIKRNARPETTYMMPRRLWSTVTTHSWSRVSRPAGSRSASRAAIGGQRRSCPPPSSAKRHEERQELIQLVVRELHRGHACARLQRGGMVDAPPPILQRVRRHPRPARRPAYPVGPIRSQDGVRRRTPHRLAVDKRVAPAT